MTAAKSDLYSAGRGVPHAPAPWHRQGDVPAGTGLKSMRPTGQEEASRSFQQAYKQAKALDKQPPLLAILLMVRTC